MYSRKEIWRISLPILVSLFVQNLINITDTAFMGRVGQVELGASALAGVLYLAFYMVTFGFSTGAQILMARRNGEAKYGTLGPIMGQGILFLEIFSIILIFASLIGTPQIVESPHLLHCRMSSRRRLHAISDIRAPIHFYRGDVPGLFRSCHPHQSTDDECSHHDCRQCHIQLHFCIRALRCTRNGYCRSCTWIRFGRSDSRIALFPLHVLLYRSGKIPTVPISFRRIRPHSRNTECIGMEHDSLLSHHRHMVSLFS